MFNRKQGNKSKPHSTQPGSPNPRIIQKKNAQAFVIFRITAYTLKPTFHHCPALPNKMINQPSGIETVTQQVHSDQSLDIGVTVECHLTKIILCYANKEFCAFSESLFMWKYHTMLWHSHCRMARPGWTTCCLLCRWLYVGFKLFYVELYVKCYLNSDHVQVMCIYKIIANNGCTFNHLYRMLCQYFESIRYKLQGQEV